ncbi:MAG: alpha/beta fold hydrolase [Crocinitomicaceae bacterium]|nr:alpha/beta fold hydrolase [Crocinitomicaceae bacterium]
MVILHGLFGSADNWQVYARIMSEHFSVYAVDLRNHGHSPHTGDMSFEAMAGDLLELAADEGLRDIILLGHSMGGKVAMTFASENSFLLERLIVADIGVRSYKPRHEKIFKGLFAVDVAHCPSRAKAEERLSPFVDDAATLQFLMKGLYWKRPGQLAWRFNLDVLYEHQNQLLKEIEAPDKIKIPTLFIRGEKSDYISENDVKEIQAVLPGASFEVIGNAGHWPHAENTPEFISTVKHFLGV